jgi:cytochrome c biogenesis protein CcmG/thiol:disulfide interchange protein DsbE
MKNLLMLLFLIGGFKSLHAQTESLNEKTDFPSIVLKDLEGKDIDLKKFTQEGKVTIVSFWATWCSPCKKELENMADVLEDWKTKYNVQLVAISIDDSRNAMKVKPYVDGKKWKFNVLVDVNSDTRRALNYPNVPYTLLVDKDGKIVYKHVGYQEGDEFVLEDQLKKLNK